MPTPPTNLSALLPSPTARLVLTPRPIPTPSPNSLLIRVHAAALNPVDWKIQAYNVMVSSYPTVLGSDVAGTVCAVGSAVPASQFKEGDRVFAFAPSIRTSNPDEGALQTYCVVEAISAGKIPQGLAFKEAAVLPMALATAGLAVWGVMGVKRPTIPPAPLKNPEGIFLVWGGASSIGSLAVQIARESGFMVYATASGKHHDYLKGLGATKLFEYRDEGVASAIVEAANKEAEAKGLTGSITYAFDAVSEGGTSEKVAEILASCNKGAKNPGVLVTSLPWPKDVEVPNNVTVGMTGAMTIGTSNSELGKWMFNEWAPAALESGALKPSPTVQVVEGGLDKAQEGLDLLRKGVSGRKLVLEVE